MVEPDEVEGYFRFSVSSEFSPTFRIITHFLKNAREEATWDNDKEWYKLHPITSRA